MKERPILFKGEMVRAILDGRKTQTRRKIKKGDWSIEAHTLETDWPYLPHYLTDGENVPVPCPYGEPGDRLWVRETFCIESSKEVAYEPPHNDGRPIRHHQDDAWGPWWEQPHYRATDPPPELEIGTGEPGVRWRPSIFMPRWASRITLEITNVRVERLQWITEADARAEGYSPKSPRYPLDWYQALWVEINGSESWTANPWVWVVGFRRHTDS